jgi:hypothetical protein
MKSQRITSIINTNDQHNSRLSLMRTRKRYWRFGMEIRRSQFDGRQGQKIFQSTATSPQTLRSNQRSTEQVLGNLSRGGGGGERGWGANVTTQHHQPPMLIMIVPIIPPLPYVLMASNKGNLPQQWLHPFSCLMANGGEIWRHGRVVIHFHPFPSVTKFRRFTAYQRITELTSQQQYNCTSVTKLWFIWRQKITLRGVPTEYLLTAT